MMQRHDGSFMEGLGGGDGPYEYVFIIYCFIFFLLTYIYLVYPPPQTKDNTAS